MKQYKAIVSDFDGTLVNENSQISSIALLAIKNYTQSGGIFSIATGRDYYGALKSICIDLKLKSLHIVRGGSEIISSTDHKVVWARHINSDVLTVLLNHLSNVPDIYYAAERGELIYTKDAKPHDMFGPNAQFGDLAAMPHDAVPKLFLTASPNKPDIVQQFHDEIKHKFPQLHVIKTTHKDLIGIDITDVNASKSSALLQYAKLMNLRPKEIIGVGDSYNDYPLLSACGFKVAMGNAPAELIEIADMVVGTQKQNGIIEVINRIS